MLNRDRSRLTTLDEAARLADLEILTKRPQDLKNIDVESLTLGQIVTLNDVVSAFQDLIGVGRDIMAAKTAGGSAADVFATPSTSERRGYPMPSSGGRLGDTKTSQYYGPGASGFASPLSTQEQNDEAESDDEAYDQDDQDAKLNAAKATFQRLLSDASGMSSPDDGDDKLSDAAQQLLAALAKAIPDDREVPTVGGTVKWADIPKDEDGIPIESWVDEYCTCDDHEAKRVAKNTGGYDQPSGMYL